MAFIPVSREQVTGGTGKQNWSSSSWGDGNSLLLVGAHTLAQLCCKKKTKVFRVYHEVEKVGKHFSALVPLFSNCTLGSGTPIMWDCWRIK